MNFSSKHCGMKHLEISLIVQETVQNETGHRKLLFPFTLLSFYSSYFFPPTLPCKSWHKTNHAFMYIFVYILARNQFKAYLFQSKHIK